MPPFVASFAFVFLIAGLFLLNRDPQARTSKALWLPVMWLAISASRPVSVWLQMGPPSSPDVYLDGSPLDRSVYLGLLSAGILVLLGRQRKVLGLLRANWIFLLFLGYCAASITWSDYPDVSSKRWIKAIGDYAMVLIVLTDLNPLSAVKRVLARVGFMLLPLSVLFIKYHPNLGRVYAAHWEGTAYNVGVASDKNMLGMTCLVFGLGSLWCALQELLKDKRTRRIGPLIAHVAVLGMVIWLFWTANSMTSLSCFLMASTLILATSHRRLARKTWLVHFLVVTMIAVSVSALFLNLGSGVVESLGRDPTLTGRTELWAQVLNLTANPVLGTGFESFWLGKRLEKLWSIYWWHPNESHDGYLEVYLNLGWIGVGLLAMILVSGYRRVIRLLRQDPGVARLCLGYFFVGVVYNFTEAAMRPTGLVWIAFMLAISLIPQPASAREQEFDESDAFYGTSESSSGVVRTTSRPVVIGAR